MSSIRVASYPRLRNILIEVSDDGVGLPAGVDPMKNGHLGFRALRSLADQLEAKITFQSDSLGLFVALELPSS